MPFNLSVYVREGFCWWLCSATVLTQIRFIWAVRGQNDGQRTYVTPGNVISLVQSKV